MIILKVLDTYHFRSENYNSSQRSGFFEYLCFLSTFTILQENYKCSERLESLKIIVKRIVIFQRNHEWLKDDQH